MEQKNTDEIDLSYLFNKISKFFKNIAKLLFAIISFFLKYIIIVVILLIAGFAIGYYLDRTEVENYNNQLIVIPNFESTEYLYNKLNALEIKIKNKDSISLKKIIGENYSLLKGIKAEPIIDLYSFASVNQERVELFKILTEKQDIPDFLNDPQNYKYNKYHHINIKVKGKERSKEIVAAVDAYLNDNLLYSEYQDVQIKNTSLQIETFTKMLSQIDTIIQATFGVENSKSNAAAVSINDNSQLNDLFISKERFLDRLLTLKKRQKDEQKVIKIAAINYNVSSNPVLDIGKKIKYPIIFVMIFAGIFLMIYIFKGLRRYADES